MSNFDKVYGLVGKSLKHSFSKEYFTAKFSNLKLNYLYQNIEIQDIRDIIPYIEDNRNLKGFNVTVPYKESIIPLLDFIDDTAKEVGAVNTVKIDEQNRLCGYNTDVIGFKAVLDDVKSMTDVMQHIKERKEAVILGSGGASKAVQYVLNQEDIAYKIVSRNPKDSNDIGYNDIYDEGFHSFSMIINATPVGMFPEIEKYPELPYPTLESHNVFIDLIYNPLETAFMKKGKTAGIKVFNGLKMLHEQAEASWNIWHNF